MTPPRILIAGIGNIFLGDDAFGVEVAQRLARRPLPDGVRVVDFGIRGLDLFYALLEGPDAAILVDASPRGQSPGTLSVIEPDTAAPAGEAPPSPMIDMHNMDPAKVLRLVASMGGRLQRILLVACEPTPPADPDDMAMGLSPPVLAAVDQAIPLIEALAAQLLHGEDTKEQRIVHESHESTRMEEEVRGP